ncbi:hypothetical protein [Leucobacter celer]|uniref:hypothetical protein n=1 Tax=Leucobacter celer TaxID=668625 RepID=UPI000A93E996|nr:hypothetical protein [Leucobacter celer]
MNEWKLKRLVAVLVALAAVVAVSGCLREVPIVSGETGNKTTNATLDEQRKWVGEQFDAGVDASGVSEGWYWGSATKVSWSESAEDRDMVLGSWFPRRCGLGGRLDESIRFKDGIEDPLAAAEKVRAFWEAEGWTVTDIRSYAPEGDPYFRADREDGAELAFQASEEGMSLEVASACSVNNTVTNWRSYVDDEPSEFERELERRGSSDG